MCPLKPGNHKLTAKEVSFHFRVKDGISKKVSNLRSYWVPTSGTCNCEKELARGELWPFARNDCLQHDPIISALKAQIPRASIKFEKLVKPCNYVAKHYIWALWIVMLAWKLEDLLTPGPCLDVQLVVGWSTFPRNYMLRHWCICDAFCIVKIWVKGSFFLSAILLQVHSINIGNLW